MKVRYYIDPTTELPHIYKHEVDESEVEDVLSKPGEDRPGREGSRIAIGTNRIWALPPRDLRTRSRAGQHLCYHRT